MVPVSVLDHVAVLDTGARIEVPAAPVTRPVTGQPPEPTPPSSPAGGAENLVRVPLGRIAHARSGDKGPNSNVGFWTGERVWPWLRSALTTELLRRLYPGAAGLRIERHEFPNLRAVHFVLHGALDEGAASNGRPDIAGKAIGEFLPARLVDVPVDLVPPEFRPGAGR